MEAVYRLWSGVWQVLHHRFPSTRLTDRRASSIQVAFSLWLDFWGTAGVWLTSELNLWSPIIKPQILLSCPHTFIIAVLGRCWWNYKEFNGGLSQPPLQTLFWLVTQSYLPNEKKKDCVTSQKSVWAAREARVIVSLIGLVTVFDAILTSRQTRLEITVFEWKSDVK